MAKIGLLMSALGLDEANANFETLATADYSTLPEVSIYGYVDCKFDGRRRMKTFNVEGISAQMVGLHNAAVAVGGDDRCRREAYFRAGHQALCLAHLFCSDALDFIAYMVRPLLPAVIRETVAGFGERGRAYEEFRHDGPVGRDTSFVIDCRRGEAELAIVTALRLYQSGAAAGLATAELHYALGSAYAAATAVATADRALLAQKIRAAAFAAGPDDAWSLVGQQAFEAA